MRITRIIGIILTISLLIPGACSQSGKVPATALIKIESGDDAVESWRPITTVISVGGVVTWLNSGYGVHYVISGEGLFDQSLSSKQSFKYTFTHSGTFTFEDDLKNPYSEVDTIIVR